MTSTDFESAAKFHTAKVLKEKHGVDIDPSDFELVWFAHVVGCKKCFLFSPKTPFYTEVTYHMFTQHLYVDVYKKQSHTEFSVFESGESVLIS